MGNKNLLHESLFFAWTEPKTGRQKVTQYKKSDPMCQAKNPTGKHTEFCGNLTQYRAFRYIRLTRCWTQDQTVP